MWLEVVFFLCLLALIVNYRQNKSQSSQIENLPIISKIPIFGSLLALASFQPDNLHLKFQEYVERFGSTFQARVFDVRVVVTADVRYAEQLLSSQQHTRKHVIYGLLRSWLGDGLLLSHGVKWQTMRKIITPTFHFKILESFVEVFDRQSTTLVERLRPLATANDAIVDIYPHVGLATLDIIAETAMGVCVNAQLDSKSNFVQAVKDVTNILATRFVRPHLVFPWTFRLFSPAQWRKQKEGIAVMHDFTEKIIEQRRKVLKTTTEARLEATSVDEDDLGIKQRLALLDVLLQSSMDGRPLSDEQIREEVNTFMFEGHDTTTSAISFCLYLLSRHGECQQKLFAEIRAHFGDDLKEREITLRDLQQLGYLNCVIKESLRLYPPIPAIGRCLKDDFKMVDVTLPAGTNVIILLWQLLRDAAVFSEPELFQPERHLEETTTRKEESRSSSSAFINIPFSAGPRNCIGQRFALFEMKMLVVKILRNYELLPLGEDVQPSIKIVLRSKTGVNMGIRPRVY